MISTKENPVSILHDYVDTGYRRDGKTTRLVDKAVQMILSGEHVIIENHPTPGRPKSPLCENERLLDRILRRLESEHKVTTDSFKQGCSYIQFTPNGLVVHRTPVIKPSQIPQPA